jgi:eukaryotic-like serine/threonine-protein kinase
MAPTLLEVGEPTGHANTVELPASVFQLGEVLSETYELKRRIGAGGMGIVFEAHDRLLNRKVAIKVSQLAGGQWTIAKEGRALAAIRHPSMVSVYALGRHRGIEYLVMERLEGGSLDAHMRQRARLGQPFTVAEVVALLIGIAEGLQAVHSAGISHRDVKPGNIMLTPGNRVVLMDFGLFIADFEQRGALAGSPEYMAPEVALDRVAAGCGRLVDLYALGVIAYELLVGRPPYTAREPAEVLGKHLREPIPDVTAVRTDVPEALRVLTRSLLAKNPDDRPGTVEEVLFRLRSIPTRPVGEPFSVLIVDDDPTLLESLRWLVARTAPDADIRTASDGQAAMVSLRKKPPQLMLVDLHLPDLNGIELCMYMRGAGLDARCQVVAVSANAAAPDLDLLRQLGITRFLPKDVNLSRAVVTLVRELRTAPKTT